MTPFRWFTAATLSAALALPAAFAQDRAAEPTTGAAPKVLRVAFPTAETGFDPARVNDIYSRTVTPHIFEGLYHYDHLARPYKIKPLTAAGMPEVSPDFKRFVVRIQPGIYFADDPAFKGQKRELVAQDYVYAFKRYADPETRSPNWGGMVETGYVGLAALRQRALDTKKPFDYDAEIPGIRALDRYTIEFRTEGPRPRLIETLATGDLFGAVAREVVEFYGDQIMGHPVGTGPFKLAQWRRSSLIVLERNPQYRDRRWDAEPNAEDAEGHALVAKFKGRRIPIVDRVEISIIEEQQPLWLAFLNGQTDVQAVPGEFVERAMPNGNVAPNLAKLGIRGQRTLLSDNTYTYFNMEDPVVGGYTPDKVALRRAIALATDVEREIRLVRRSQAIPSQSPLSPHTTGYDPAFKSEMSEYAPAKAKALLDLFGYVDRDGDGWRELPDGSPLVLKTATQPDQISRQFDELRRRNLNSIGLRIEFEIGQWPEQLKAARSGKLMMWALAGTSAAPDGQPALARYHSPQFGGQNLARFKLPAMDAIYDKLSALPDGPERDALFLEAKKLAVAYMPYHFNVHRIANTLVHPWLEAYRRPTFWLDWYHMVDIDPSKRTAP